MTARTEVTNTLDCQWQCTWAVQPKRSLAEPRAQGILGHFQAAFSVGNGIHEIKKAVCFREERFWASRRCAPPRSVRALRGTSSNQLCNPERGVRFTYSHIVTLHTI